MNIYIGNLPYSISEDELRDLFAAHGEVSSANIIMDKMEKTLPCNKSSFWITKYEANTKRH